MKRYKKNQLQFAILSGYQSYECMISTFSNLHSIKVGLNCVGGGRKCLYRYKLRLRLDIF